jgi:lipoprotein NlpI
MLLLFWIGLVAVDDPAARLVEYQSFRDDVMQKTILIGLAWAALQITPMASAQVNSEFINCEQEAGTPAPSRPSTDCPKASTVDDLASQEWTPDALTFHQRALDEVKRGDLDGALRDLDEAIRLNPYAAEAYYTRGTIYARAKSYDRAMEDYDKAISLNPFLADAFHQRALLYQGRGDYRQAIKDFDVVLGLEPNNPGALRDRGDAFRAIGDYDRAVDDYQSAMGIDRATIDPYSMANLLFFQGRFSQSAQTMQQVVQAKPDDQHAALWRYLAVAKSRDVPTAARDLANQSAKFMDKRWPAAAVDYYLGKIDEKAMHAAAGAADASESQEQNCQAIFYAAEAKLLKSANEEAIALLREARSQCPPNTAFFHGASAELKRLGQL